MSARAPVVVIAALDAPHVRGRERVERQRAQARAAVRASAALRGAQLAELCKDSSDVPLPSRGWYWSLSHCPSSVVGVVHACPVGVDVESLRTVRSDVAARVLSESELALFERRGELEFLRAWTGKEAVLKEFGVGLAGLERCRIVAVHDTRLELRFDGHSRVVHQSLQPRRVVSLSSADGAPPEFLVLDQPLLEPHEVQP